MDWFCNCTDHRNNSLSRHQLSRCWGERYLVHLFFSCIALFYGIWVL